MSVASQSKVFRQEVFRSQHCEPPFCSSEDAWHCNCTIKAVRGRSAPFAQSARHPIGFQGKEMRCELTARPFCW
jgi:hypothetical protein